MCVRLVNVYYGPLSFSVLFSVEVGSVLGLLMDFVCSNGMYSLWLGLVGV